MKTSPKHGRNEQKNTQRPKLNIIFYDQVISESVYKMNRRQVRVHKLSLEYKYSLKWPEDYNESQVMCFPSSLLVLFFTTET